MFQERILELHRQGLSNEEIVKTTGRSYPSVCRVVKRGCIQRSKMANWTEEEISKASGILKAGSRYTIVRWLRPLLFEGIQYNWRGNPFFMFRSEAGFRESFTIQQLADVEFGEVKEAIAI